MLTITAVIRARAGHEATIERALRAVIAAVKADKPGTLAYFVSRSTDDPAVFTTFERFVDEAAMTRHNDSQTVAGSDVSVTDGDGLRIGEERILLWGIDARRNSSNGAGGTGWATLAAVKPATHSNVC
jgi:quinol monooxygenase YgiN